MLPVKISVNFAIIEKVSQCALLGLFVYLLTVNGLTNQIHTKPILYFKAHSLFFVCTLSTEKYVTVL